MWSGVAWVSLAFGAAVAGQNAPDVFYSALRPCPAACANSTDSWTVYSSLQRLEVCREPMLLDFAIRNALDDPTTTPKLRVCTSGTSVAALFKGDTDSTSISTTCLSARESNVSMDMFISGEQGDAGPDNLQTAVQDLQQYMSDGVHCSTSFLVGYSQGAVVAIYSGVDIDNSRTVPSVMQRLSRKIDSGSPSNAILQLCGGGRNADSTFGVAINTNGDLAAVQKAILAWSNGACYNSTQAPGQSTDISIYEAPLISAVNNGTGRNFTDSHNLLATLSDAHVNGIATLEVRGDCKTATIASGDSCASLAKKCGIDDTDFNKYNSASNLCSTLTVGGIVCCSSGTLPDITPKQDSNGTCATYTVKSDDYCTKIAASNGLTVDKLEGFNNKTTWGWNGCNDLAAGINICLSKGTPPLPAPVPNAVCGPVVLGTKHPSGTQTLADLNPCPLNSCCDVWGQCGITPEYCTVDLGPSGNPGTAPPNKNGCVSNCNTKVTNNSKKPSSFISVAYYEAWNWDRPCLNYRAQDLGGSTYTHAHWGFATVTESFDVTVNDTYKQLDDFLALPLKRILSFGGWGFSTDPATYDVLRQAMTPANVDTFVSNIAKYLSDKGFDGIDIDWEYPGAPDIPGIPAGLPSDGPNYLAFLKKLRPALDKAGSKTISIAAPASYWYLRAFPIADMAKELDYIVYMTYDLHGQWDYGSKYSQDGCPAGNCLRSHVNLTETSYALAMITKAGVDANKITVGVSSYGRSFGITDPAACEKSLSDPKCTFTGPASGATPGNCTVTAGYISNAEIGDIMDLNSPGTKYVFDAGSDSDTLIYGNNWVAYMSDTTKSTRTTFYQGLNFAGTVDWAVDLQEYTDDDGDPGGDDEVDLPDATPLAPCNAKWTTFDQLDQNAGSIPEHCTGIYTVGALKSLLTTTLTNYTNMMNNGYDQKFSVYANAVADEAGSSLLDFINGNGGKYAKCIVTETTNCCDQCNVNPPTASYCDYCFDGSCYTTVDNTKRDGGGGGTSLVPKVVNVNKTEPCPPDYSKRGYGPSDPYEQSVYWTWTNSSGFFADLELGTGIPQSKTKMGNYDNDNDCPPSAGPGDPCWDEGMYFNVPIINGYSSSDVTNPKDVISKALSKVQSLPGQIDSALSNLQLDGYYGDDSQLIDALSMPVFMLASATENMQSIENVADQITEAERKAFILAFLTAIFTLVPIVGEVVGGIADLAGVGAIVSLLGAAGNAALDIYTIVDDPNNAPLAIFDLILSPLALADAATVAKAANVRRAMKTDDVAKLGKDIQSKLTTIDKLKGTCIPDMSD